jgi:hypothetical protein
MRLTQIAADLDSLSWPRADSRLNASIGLSNNASAGRRAKNSRVKEEPGSAGRHGARKKYCVPPGTPLVSYHGAEGDKTRGDTDKADEYVNDRECGGR